MSLGFPSAVLPVLGDLGQKENDDGMNFVPVDDDDNMEDPLE